MNNSTAYKKLLYEHEVLWARHEIRNFHLKRIGEKIYDDIGQVLSLVRIQLCQTLYEKDALKTNAAESGELVGKAMRGLREIYHSVYPETELLEKEGLIKTLEHELELLGIDKEVSNIKVNGASYDLVSGTQLIVFRMLQEILFSIIRHTREKSIQVKVLYEKTFVRFTIEYNGKMLNWKQLEVRKSNHRFLSQSSLPERAKLIDGKLSVENLNANTTCIGLTVPFKIFIYE